VRHAAGVGDKVNTCNTCTVLVGKREG